jgi:hypothetical protein
MGGVRTLYSPWRSSERPPPPPRQTSRVAVPGLEALQDDKLIHCGGDRRPAEEPTVRFRRLGVGLSQLTLPAPGRSPMPTCRVYLNSCVINRAASSDWQGPIWQTIAVASWGCTNCTAEPLRSSVKIATEAILSPSNREISDSAPWD